MREVRELPSSNLCGICVIDAIRLKETIIIIMRYHFIFNQSLILVSFMVIL